MVRTTGILPTHLGAPSATEPRTADRETGAKRRHLSLAPVCRATAVGTAALWLLSQATATGVTAQLLPAALAPFHGQLYLAFASQVDVFATIALILFIPAVFSLSRYLNAPDAAEVDTPTPRARPRFPRPWLALSFCFLIILLGGSLALLSVPPSPATVLTGAVVVQRGGFTQAALNGLEQQIPSNYNASDFSLYFFASGWAQDLGRSQAAIRWDVDLIRSSAQVGSMTGLTAGLSQYGIETGRAVPGSLARLVTRASDGHWWKPTAITLLSWDETARPGPTVASLLAEARLIGGARATQLTGVIGILHHQPVPR